MLGLAYPCLAPLNKAIDTQIQVITTLRKIDRARQNSIDIGGEPVIMEGVTFWPGRCGYKVFQCGKRKVTLRDYYRITVK